MARDQAPLWLAALAWEDAYAAVPKHRRLYQAFKSALLAGKVPTGTLSPSSRRRDAAPRIAGHRCAGA